MESTAALQVQQRLFNIILTQIGEKKALPILCDILSLNKSSVYSRLNGSKALALEELLQLMQHFNISSDQIFEAPGEIGKFKMQSMNKQVRSGREFLSGMAGHFNTFTKIPDLQMWFCTDELSFFHCMNFRELALFKLFTYARINWQLPYTENTPFNPDTFAERELYDELMQTILRQYNAVRSIEFWTDDLYHNAVKQVRHFAAAGQIENDRIATVLLDQLAQLCEHQYAMAKEGIKWSHGQKNPRSNAICGKFELYHNSMAPSCIAILGESSVQSGVDRKSTRLNSSHSTLSRMPSSA